MAGNRRSIPEVRDRLREIADEEGLPELSDLADEMYRNTSKKRAPTKSPKLTAALAQQIRDFVAQNPDMHQQDVANHFNVNHGRVSEAVNNLV